MSAEQRTVRLQKYLADAGVASRRAAEQLIVDGRVSVNGAIVRILGTKVQLDDRVTVDGRGLALPTETITILFNKPRGVMTSRVDPEGRKTIYDVLPKELSPLRYAGRLDCNSEGALILTNDGALIQRITHPGFHLCKTYEVDLDQALSETDLTRLKTGIRFAEGLAICAEIRPIGRADGHAYEAVLTQGLNRQVRRMMEALGKRVLRLKRTAIGSIKLGSLRSGQYKRISADEI